MCGEDDSLMAGVVGTMVAWWLSGDAREEWEDRRW